MMSFLFPAVEVFAQASGEGGLLPAVPDKRRLFLWGVGIIALVGVIRIVKRLMDR